MYIKKTFETRWVASDLGKYVLIRRLRHTRPIRSHAGLDHGGMDSSQARPFVVRRAALADAAALARLREVMLSDMGMLAAGTDPGWRDKAEAWSDLFPAVHEVSCQLVLAGVGGSACGPPRWQVSV
jgi:hypothetical protein